MVIDYIVDFTSYLNTYGYAISSDKINRFFIMMQDEEIDFSNQEDLLDLMRIVFCSNKLQSKELPKHFKDFFKDKNELNYIAKTQAEIKKGKENLKNLIEVNKLKIKNLKAEMETVSDEVKLGENKLKKLLTKDEEAFVEENLEAIKKIKIKNKKAMTFIRECIIEQDVQAFLTYSSNFIDSISYEFVDLSEKALRKTKLDDFNVYQKMFNILKRLAKLESRQIKTLDEQIKKVSDGYLKKIEALQKEIDKENKKHEKIQKQLDALIAQRNLDKLTKKKASSSHREVFRGGSAVQLVDEALPEFFNTSFMMLKNEELNNIYYYIKKNLLKFKTRMARNINTKEKQNIDIKATIQNACKTGGLPLVIEYEKPKANKTKLVLILDVSGSCREASEMMLTFMHLLQSVFPGGCKTFAFVDSLYNISEIMQSKNIEKSIQDVFDTIPRRGVYSNYYNPLRSLWVENKKDITSDSIVIFMGDARNNKNPEGIEYIKNISRRAKKAYWLNTEKSSEWGSGDSLAFEYGKYFKMYEILNASNLIGFINEM